MAGTYINCSFQSLSELVNNLALTNKHVDLATIITKNGGEYVMCINGKGDTALLCLPYLHDSIRDRVPASGKAAAIFHQGLAENMSLIGSVTPLESKLILTNYGATIISGKEL